MPIKSLAQMRLMYAAKNGYTNKVPKKVAKEYIDSTPKNKYGKLKAYFKKKSK